MKYPDAIILTLANLDSLCLGERALADDCKGSKFVIVTSFLVFHASFEELSMLFSFMLPLRSLVAGLGAFAIAKRVSTASLSLGSSRTLLGLPATC